LFCSQVAQFAVLFEFLDNIWEQEEEEVRALINNPQLPTKIQHQLQDVADSFRKCLDLRNDPDEALRAHRACIKQIQFAHNQLAVSHQL
jgi:hypothetical protein